MIWFSGKVKIFPVQELLAVDNLSLAIPVGHFEHG
jgi:hypothetical protein